MSNLNETLQMRCINPVAIPNDERWECWYRNDVSGDWIQAAVVDTEAEARDWLRFRLGVQTQRVSVFLPDVAVG